MSKPASSSSSAQDERRQTNSNSNNNGTHHLPPPNRNPKRIPPNYNVASLYGSIRAECGYCNGDRLDLMTVPNPPSPRLVTSDTETGTSSSTGTRHRRTKDLLVIPKNPPPSPTSSSTITSSTTSKSYVILFTHLHPSDYQNLIDAGWRRSGRNVYLPDNWESCCPQIPIRLEVGRFEKSRSQRRVERRFYGWFQVDDDDDGDDGDSSDRKNVKRRPIENTKKQKQRDEIQSMGRNIILNSPFVEKLASLSEKAFRTMIQDDDDDDDDDGSDGRGTMETIVEEAKEKRLYEYGLVKSYSPKPPHGNVKSSTDGGTTSDEDDDEHVRTVVVVLSNKKLCPYLHGASKGRIDKVKVGNRMVRALSNDVTSSFSTEIFDSSVGGDGDVILKDAKVDSIELHEKSGHINVTLELVLKSSTESSSLKRSESSMGTTDAIEEEEEDDGSNSIRKRKEDIIGAFIEDSKRMNSQTLETETDTEKTETSAIGNGTRHSHPSSNGHQSKTQSKSRTRTPSYTITVRSVPAHISLKQPEVHRLYAKYQSSIHSDPDPYETTSSTSSDDHHENDESVCEIPQMSALTPSDFDRLYPRYSETRRDKIYESYVKFVNFLGESPLEQPSTSSSTYHPDHENFQPDKDGYDTSVPYGCYHQQYRINDRHLFAVGVVDVLPSCLSAVYSFFDPTLSRTLNLGKITALREIEWVRRASARRPELKYYYLGFYIRSCGKMRYKAEYGPSELLCPKNGTWVGFDLAERRLEVRSPVRHCCDISTRGADEVEVEMEKRKRGRPNEVRKVEGNRHEGYRRGYDTTNVSRNIYLDIQPDSPLFKINDLDRRSQEFLKGPIDEFIEEIGPEMSQRCVLQWYS